MKFILISVSLILTSTAYAQVQNNPWTVISNNLRPALSSWGIQVPSLGSTGNPCIDISSTSGQFGTTTCGGSGGTNYFTNSGASTTLTTGSILQAATLNATSTSGTSNFGGTITVGTGGIPPIIIQGSSGIISGNSVAGTDSGTGFSLAGGVFNSISNTGGYTDSAGSGGLVGQVLQVITGPKTKWVATSSLGITSTNFFTNSSATTSLTTGSILAASTGTFGLLNATSTTGTSTFSSNLFVKGTTNTGGNLIRDSLFDGNQNDMEFVNNGGDGRFHFISAVGSSLGFIFGTPATQYSFAISPYTLASQTYVDSIYPIFMRNANNFGGNDFADGGGNYYLSTTNSNSANGDNTYFAVDGGLVGVGTASPSGVFDVEAHGGNIFLDSTTDIYVGDVNGEANGSYVDISDAATTMTLENGMGINVSGPTVLNNTVNIPGLTISSPVFTNASHNLISTGIVPVSDGGTGSTSYAIGNILVASGTNPISQLAASTSGSILQSQGSGLPPKWVATSSLGISGGGTNYFTNSGASTTLAIGSNLLAGIGTFGTVIATSTTGTSTFAGNLTVTGTASISGMVCSAFVSGTWCNLPTTGPSAIGTGGAGVNPFIAYVAGINQYFNGAGTADMAIRNANGTRILMGIDNGSGNANPEIILTNSSINLQQTILDPSSIFAMGTTSSPSDLTIQAFTSSDSPFQVASSTGRTELIVSSSGNVGIGTTTPGSLLSVQGNAYFGGNITATGTLTVNGIGTSTIAGSLSVGSTTASTTFMIDKNGHEFIGGPLPTCTTGCTMVSGSDGAMRIVTGSSISSVTITFSIAWTNPSNGLNISPYCWADDESGVSTGVEASSTPTTVILTLPTALSSKNINVNCRGSLDQIQ